MGEKGQLWDDSALINAFDQAISKYKKMHGKGYNGNSTIDVSGDFISSTIIDVPQNDYSNPETVGNGNNSSSHVSEVEVEVEVEEAGHVGTVTEHEVIDSQISNEHALESYSLPQDQSQYYSGSTKLDEYNVLYKQYYEIEEQRQKILQQMQHFSNEYYQYSGQEYEDTTQTPCDTMVVSCCPCQRPVASCSTVTCPSVDAHDDGLPSTKGLKLKSATENVDFVTAALGAAEKALSSLKDKTSVADPAKENGLCTVIEQNAESETDLSTVLIAWYSAGFYTGKYLTEKSLAKKQHD